VNELARYSVPSHWSRRILVGILAAGLSACATYEPKPLPTGPDVVSDVGGITVDAAKLSLPELHSHRFDAADGLDMTEVAMLAVVNNPALRAARAKAGVARAQAFAAGLLPDPQLSASRDVPRESDPTLTSAYSIGLAYDLNALVTRGASRKAATASARQTDLELLWQEWQAVAKARSLFVRITTEEQLLALLRRQRALYGDRYDRAQRALEKGDLTADQVAVYLAALQDLDKQINDRERQLNDRRHELDALLGLSPSVTLELVGAPSLPPLDDAQVRRALADLPHRRPDLLALQAGYEAQEQHVREAILAQFPAFNLALSRARDTSDIHTRGLAVTLTLPLLNGNRGTIAVERATRAQLYAEYQARLDAADSDVRRLLANQRLLATQKAEVTSNLERLQRVSAAAARAFREGNMDTLKYVDLETALINARTEAANLNALMGEQRIALQTLLGSGLATKLGGAEGR
jgi:outer membrane protein TolC